MTSSLAPVPSRTARRGRPVVAHGGHGHGPVDARSIGWAVLVLATFALAVVLGAVLVLVVERVRRG